MRLRRTQPQAGVADERDPAEPARISGDRLVQGHERVAERPAAAEERGQDVDEVARPLPEPDGAEERDSASVEGGQGEGDARRELALRDPQGPAGVDEDNRAELPDRQQAVALPAQPEAADPVLASGRVAVDVEVVPVAAPPAADHPVLEEQRALAPVGPEGDHVRSAADLPAERADRCLPTAEDRAARLVVYPRAHVPRHGDRAKLRPRRQADDPPQKPRQRRLVARRQERERAVGRERREQLRRDELRRDDQRRRLLPRLGDRGLHRGRLDAGPACHEREQARVGRERRIRGGRDHGLLGKRRRLRRRAVPGRGDGAVADDRHLRRIAPRHELVRPSPSLGDLGHPREPRRRRGDSQWCLSSHARRLAGRRKADRSRRKRSTRVTRFLGRSPSTSGRT